MRETRDKMIPRHATCQMTIPSYPWKRVVDQLSDDVIGIVQEIKKKKHTIRNGINWEELHREIKRYV